MAHPPSLNITVVEDNDDQRELAVELMRAQGHNVMSLASAESLDAVGNEPGASPPDLFIIDINLPGEDGLSLARRVRAEHPNTGIVMMTARRQARDRVSGYDHGADLYLTKPVSPAELLAAVASLVRRLPERLVKREVALPVTFDLDTVTLRLTGPTASVALTPPEAAVIEALARAPKRRIDLDRIAELLGQSFEAFNKASLEVRVVRLRRKLIDAGGEAASIKAVRGHGYQLCAQVRLS